MSLRKNAMLFCPPQPPMQLEGMQRVVIGRHRDCEFPIRQEDISRRHSEVVDREGSYVVRDLGSTNGTFVNGQPVVGEQPLLPGDRIEIGSTTITFCEVETAGEPAVPDSCPEDQTIVFTRPREGFHGDLAEIPAFALLQVLEVGTKTGLLTIDRSDSVGAIWLVAGAPVHAETGKQLGFDAAITIAHAEGGQFRFEPEVDAPERTIDATVTELLLEAARQQDEASVTR
jgi:pSer/pThr/pTyr-binding forkhead associated (FHA) protein